MSTGASSFQHRPAVRAGRLRQRTELCEKCTPAPRAAFMMSVLVDFWMKMAVSSFCMAHPSGLSSRRKIGRKIGRNGGSTASHWTESPSTAELYGHHFVSQEPSNYLVHDVHRPADHVTQHRVQRLVCLALVHLPINFATIRLQTAL